MTLQRYAMSFIIPMKLPSLNEYVNVCRSNRFQAGKFKKDIEEVIMWYLRDMPTYTKPIRISFLWVEDNKRRDYDNIAFAKKFILDAMVKSGKLADDNRKYVVGFADSFAYDKTARIELDISQEA